VGIRVGVVGTGRLGREHVRVLKKVSEVEHVACYDVVTERAEGVARKNGAEAFSDLHEMMDSVDAVSIVVPTVKHAEISIQALERGNNIFVEKPIAASVPEAEQIIEAARKAQRVLQVGHIERFNAAVRDCRQYIKSPAFIEVHRLAPFTVRGIDVSVIMDLMIHDIDLLSWFLGKKPVDIRAKGAAILTSAPDIVNARLEYDDGCVANLTASRVSIEPMRKVRIFSDESYISMDLLRGAVRRFRKGSKFYETAARLQTQQLNPEDVSLHDVLDIEETKTEGEEPLFNELQSFCRTVANGDLPAVTGEDGLMALEVATDVLNYVRSKR